MGAMSSFTLQLRPMQQTDFAKVGGLLAELGYPTSPDELKARYEAIDLARNSFFVMEKSDGQLIAWMHVMRRDLLTSAPRAEIAGLVVTYEFQGQGVGKQFVAQAEKWARERGLELLHVSSNLERTGSHHFYKQLGFEHAKSSAIYKKPLYG